MAKSGQYMPHRSQPLHFSGATTWGGWYPFELKAEESASTLVGQNSTQKPQALQRSTTIETRPFATGFPPRQRALDTLETLGDYGLALSQQGVMGVTNASDFYTPARTLPHSRLRTKKGRPQNFRGRPAQERTG